MAISSKALTKFLLAYILIGMAVWLPRSSLAAEQRVALVIGNSAYPSSRLRNPVNDARAMADTLRALGFDVMLRTETSRRDMARAISEFGGKLAAGNIALFYYAGHGMQVRGKNYLIPIDAEIDNEDMVRAEGIDLDRLFEGLKNSRLNVVVLDACRDNPFEKFRGGSGGLAEIDAPIGTFLAYATSPGKVAADGAGANGLYTTELLKAIEVPGLKIEDVFKQVRINVLRASNNKQVPWESSSMTGEFYFRPDAKSAAVDARLRRADQERLELQQEMEKLRAEITRLVSTALGSSGNAQPVHTALATTTSAAAVGLPSQKSPLAPAIPAAPATPIASIATTPSAAAVGPPSQKSPVAPAIPAAPATPIASIATTPSTAAAGLPPQKGPIAQATPAARMEVWDKRIALLNGLRGKLSYSSAIAILFDIKNDNDLTGIVKFERFLKSSSWASALAMGVDEEGKTHWANASRYGTVQFARETALEFCAKLAETKDTEEKPIIKCELAIVNSELQEKALLAVAEQLKRSDPTAARDAYLASIAAAPVESFTPGGGGAMGNNLPGGQHSARVYTPSR